MSLRDAARRDIDVDEDGNAFHPIMTQTTEHCPGAGGPIVHHRPDRQAAHPNCRPDGRHAGDRPAARRRAAGPARAHGEDGCRVAAPIGWPTTARASAGPRAGAGARPERCRLAGPADSGFLPRGGLCEGRRTAPSCLGIEPRLDYYYVPRSAQSTGPKNRPKGQQLGLFLARPRPSAPCSPRGYYP